MALDFKCQQLRSLHSSIAYLVPLIEISNVLYDLVIKPFFKAFCFSVFKEENIEQISGFFKCCQF